MIVLNDTNGAMDFVWQWEMTPECTASGTATLTNILMPIHAACGVWWGNETGVGISVVVTGYYRPIPFLQVGSPSYGSAPFFGQKNRTTITVTAPGIAWTEVTQFDTITAKRLFEPTTITAEMDDALLTGDCGESGFLATLEYSAIRIKKNGTLVASTGAGTITDFNYDPRRNHFRVDPYVGPNDWEAWGGVPLPCVPTSGITDPANVPWVAANNLQHNNLTPGRMCMLYDPPEGRVLS